MLLFSNISEYCDDGTSLEVKKARAAACAKFVARHVPTLARWEL